MNGCNLQAVTHTIIDHVRSLCSCCLDCLEDVHSSFNFDPLNFSHTSDEHTTARHAVTERQISSTYREYESAACTIQRVLYIAVYTRHIHTYTHTHIHTHTHTHTHTHRERERERETHTHTHTHKHMHTQLFTKIDNCIHKRTHIY